MSAIAIRDNPTGSRYELLIDDEVRGSIGYRARQNTVTLIHTEIDSELEGRGLGSRLVHDTLEDIRARGLRLVPVCPFVRSYLTRHPEYMDLVA
jgi:uncharacterized protein